jgi:hypothetical protein
MARSQRTFLLFLLGASLLLLGAGAAWLALSPAAAPSGDPAPAVPAEPIAAAEPPPPEIEIHSPAGPEVQPSGATTVAWPVQVALELVRPARLPRAEGAAAMGSGRSARLSGRILAAGERGVAAQIEFTSGLNTGRVLEANESGEFGAIDLYPGLAEVKVSGRGIPGSVRMVRLRQNVEADPLNISYDLPGSLTGTVYDDEGNPLADAEVELDGQTAITTENGEYYFPSMTAGLNLVLVVRAEGFAWYSRTLAVPVRRHIAHAEGYDVRLQRAAELEIAVPEKIGGPAPARAVLWSSEIEQMAVERRFPWQRVSPVSVPAGSSSVVSNLPPGRVHVRVFHEGATAKPPVAIAILRPGERTTVTVHLEPAAQLFGKVTDEEGRAVPDARVRLEAPDVAATTLTHLQQTPDFLEKEMLPLLAPAAQETRADAFGRFVLSSWAGFGPARYLSAESPDGSRWGVRIVRESEGEVDLAIAPFEASAAKLSLNFPGRTQGLPVVASINGAPQPEVLLPPRETLDLGELPQGTWRLRAAWNGRSILRSGYEDFELSQETVHTIELPPDAIRGQDPDTLSRARKP